MTFNNSRFNNTIRVGAQFGLLCIVFLSFFSFSLRARDKVSDNDRRNARVQATYITRLVKYIKWECNSTDEHEIFKIVILGNENVGFVNSLEFLVEQSNLSVDGHSVQIFHFSNSEIERAYNFINNGVHLIYLTQDCQYNLLDIKPIRKGALLISEGRDFVVNNSGCIAFEKSRNRIRLVVNKTCFSRKFSKVNPVLSSLKSVVEIVSPIQ